MPTTRSKASQAAKTAHGTTYEAKRAKTAQHKAATAADAPAGADDGVGHNLLREVLQRGILNTDAAAICSLISSSKAAADVVAECCKGALVLALEPSDDGYVPNDAARGKAQAAWLRRNGSLVSGLSCMHTAGSGSIPGPPGACWHRNFLKPAFVELLPTLVRSTPQLSSVEGGISLLAAGSAAGVRKVAANLAALTNLTHLVLGINDCKYYGGPGPVLSSLKKLKALSSCELCIAGSGPNFMQMSDAGLQHLPAWLTSLRLAVRLGLPNDDQEEFMAEAGMGEMQAMMEEMGFPMSGLDGMGGAMFGTPYPTSDQPPLLLGHLTALKELRPTNWGTHMSVLDIREGDVLPPNLTVLELDADSRTLGGLLKGRLAAPTVKPLTTLRRLQELTICTSTLPATQLQRLATALTALTAVTLGYSDMAAAAAAAPAWTKLPLVALNLSTNGSSSWNPDDAEGSTVQVVLSALSQLSGLTQLSIGRRRMDVTPKQLAATLAPLTSLVKLELQGILKEEEATPPTHTKGKRRPAAAAKESDDAGADAEGAAVLSHQLAALPNLVHLTAQGTRYGGGGMPVDPDIIAAGANASQLTHLKLGAL